MTTSWTVEDKTKLLQVLQQYGASDLELIQRKIPHKTIAEIRYICDKHTKLALTKWCSEENKKFQRVVIKDWLLILKQLNAPYRNTVLDVIPRVLKYIALYEKRTGTSHICLRDCYLVLADISNGLASKHLDESTNHFFFECVTKLAEALKNGETESYKNYLRNLNNLNNLLKQAGKDTQVSPILNPLQVPTNLLKMSEVDKLVDIFE